MLNGLYGDIRNLHLRYSVFYDMADGIQMVNKTFSLPMGTRFVAGESTEGNTQYYFLQKKHMYF